MHKKILPSIASLALLFAANAESDGKQSGRGTVQLAVYALGNNDIAAAKEYGELGLVVAPGISLACGASISEPRDFYYGLIGLHSNKKIIGWTPAMQIGLSHFEMKDYWVIPSEKSGLLMGVSLQYPINHFSVIDLNYKVVNDSLKIGHSSSEVAALGVRLFI